MESDESSTTWLLKLLATEQEHSVGPYKLVKNHDHAISVLDKDGQLVDASEFLQYVGLTSSSKNNLHIMMRNYFDLYDRQTKAQLIKCSEDAQALVLHNTIEEAGSINTLSAQVPENFSACLDDLLSETVPSSQTSEEKIGMSILTSSFHNCSRDDNLESSQPTRIFETTETMIKESSSEPYLVTGQSNTQHYVGLRLPEISQFDHGLLTGLFVAESLYSGDPRSFAETMESLIKEIRLSDNPQYSITTITGLNTARQQAAACMGFQNSEELLGVAKIYVSRDIKELKTKEHHNLLTELTRDKFLVFPVIAERVTKFAMTHGDVSTLHVQKFFLCEDKSVSKVRHILGIISRKILQLSRFVEGKRLDIYKNALMGQSMIGDYTWLVKQNQLIAAAEVTMDEFKPTKDSELFSHWSLVKTGIDEFRGRLSETIVMIESMIGKKPESKVCNLLITAMSALDELLERSHICMNVFATSGTKLDYPIESLVSDISLIPLKRKHLMTILHHQSLTEMAGALLAAFTKQTPYIEEQNLTKIFLPNLAGVHEEFRKAIYADLIQQDGKHENVAKLAALTASVERTTKKHLLGPLVMLTKAAQHRYTETTRFIAMIVTNIRITNPEIDVALFLENLLHIDPLVRGETREEMSWITQTEETLKAQATMAAISSMDRILSSASLSENPSIIAETQKIKKEISAWDKSHRSSERATDLARGFFSAAQHHFPLPSSKFGGPHPLVDLRDRIYQEIFLNLFNLLDIGKPENVLEKLKKLGRIMTTSSATPETETLLKFNVEDEVYSGRFFTKPPMSYYWYQILDMAKK